MNRGKAPANTPIPQTPAPIVQMNEDVVLTESERDDDETDFDLLIGLF